MFQKWTLGPSLGGNHQCHYQNSFHNIPHFRNGAWRHESKWKFTASSPSLTSHLWPHIGKVLYHYINYNIFYVMLCPFAAFLITQLLLPQMGKVVITFVSNFNVNISTTIFRGGSKGIPLKNLAPLGSRPLLAWALGAVLEFGNHHQYHRQSHHFSRKLFVYSKHCHDPCRLVCACFWQTILAWALGAVLEFGKNLHHL